MRGARRKRRRGRSRASKVVLALMAFVVIAGAGAVLAANWALSAMDPGAAKEVPVSVGQGSSSGGIAKTLKDAGLIRSELAFKIYVRVSGKASSLQAGNYLLNTGMGTVEIVDTLEKGVKREAKTIVIKEGWDLNRISKYLEGEGFSFTAEDFLNETRDNFAFYREKYRFLESVPESRVYKLEGYLSGDTFQVYPEATPRDIIIKMLDRFDRVFKEEYYGIADQMGFTVDQIVTMGSIVERETILNEELPVVASVFYNRLASSSFPRLESCATLQYIYQDYQFTFTQKQMAIDNPYNTYKYSGLPAGPISNLRDEALDAAFHPARTDYYFFCSKNDNTGSSAFASTYSQHQANVRKYLR